MDKETIIQKVRDYVYTWTMSDLQEMWEFAFELMLLEMQAEHEANREETMYKSYRDRRYLEIKRLPEKTTDKTAEKTALQEADAKYDVDGKKAEHKFYKTMSDALQKRKIDIHVINKQQMFVDVGFNSSQYTQWQEN